MQLWTLPRWLVKRELVLIVDILVCTSSFLVGLLVVVGVVGVVDGVCVVVGVVVVNGFVVSVAVGVVGGIPLKVVIAFGQSSFIQKVKVFLTSRLKRLTTQFILF